MLVQAKNTGMRLISEDSGIAMPLSLLVFLFLTFLCMSVFAIGEVVRARTELQYKVDNAAYAAALVQADSLSRIAVLNRAMVWTYVQLNRMQMDYIMNRWLSEARYAFENDANDCLNEYVQTGCPELHTFTVKTRTFEQHAGKYLKESETLDPLEYNYGKDDRFYGLSFFRKEEVQARVLVGIETIPEDLHGILAGNTQTEINAKKKNARNLRDIWDKAKKYDGYQILAPEIDNAKNNLASMKSESESIVNQMDVRIKNAVKESLKENYCVFAGKDNITNDKKTPDYWDYFQNEDELLTRYNGVSELKIDKMQHDKNWWVASSGQQQGKSVIERHYVYSENFKLSWNGYWVSWLCTDKTHIPTVHLTKSTSCIPGQDPVSGASWEGNWKSTGEIEPRKLKEAFFGKDGALVVAAKREIPGLFAGINLAGSFWNRFKVDGDMWCVSAARAGYRMKNDPAGQYENSKFGQEEKWNLFADDWDAAFLPVSRCWKSWNGGEFKGDSAPAVLSAVKVALNIGSPTSSASDEVNKDMMH